MRTYHQALFMTVLVLVLVTIYLTLLVHIVPAILLKVCLARGQTRNGSPRSVQP